MSQIGTSSLRYSFLHQHLYPCFPPSCKFVKKLCMALDFTTFLLSLGRVVKSLYPTYMATNSISSSNIERQLVPDITHHGLIKKIISWVFSLYKTFIHWSNKYLQSARHILSASTESVNKTDNKVCLLNLIFQQTSTDMQYIDYAR